MSSPQKKTPELYWLVVEPPIWKNITVVKMGIFLT